MTPPLRNPGRVLLSRDVFDYGAVNAEELIRCCVAAEG